MCRSWDFILQVGVVEDLKRQEGHQADTVQDILLQIGGIGPPPIHKH